METASIDLNHLESLLLQLANRDLTEGADINDHPAELARQVIMRQRAELGQVEEITPATLNAGRKAFQDNARNSGGQQIRAIYKAMRRAALQQ